MIKKQKSECCNANIDLMDKWEYPNKKRCHSCQKPCFEKGHCKCPRYIECKITKCIDCELQQVSYKKWDWNDIIINIQFPPDFNERYEKYKKELLNKK